MRTHLLALAALACGSAVNANADSAIAPAILTPAPSASPRINGPSVFGFTPGNPVLYSIPATGERPMTFGALGLPDGLSIDSQTGRISGKLGARGDYPIVLVAENKHGRAEKRFTLKCGDEICLTPPLGWNSWNCWAISVDQEKVARAARAFVRLGLDRHGWTYINIDDGWQGARGGKELAIQPNEKFPDMAGLSREVHGLGLKLGIYSSPWKTTYGNYVGGTSDDPRGSWTKVEGGFDKYSIGHKQGTHTFAPQDARQFAAWGIDYLKYDWFPNNVEHTREMSLALRASGRDIVFSLSNNAPFAIAAELSKWANCWRTTGDIVDGWETTGQWWEHSVTEIGFNQDRWAQHQRPGHYNDADMLVLGHVGWGPALHKTHLTPAQQYSHVSLWCMLSAPMLLGCDLDQMDDFTLGLLTNDEVLALNQDALCVQASRVGTLGAVDVYQKPLEDGTVALGFFNRGNSEAAVSLKLNELELNDTYTARDLWRQSDVGVFTKILPAKVEAHGVLLYKLSPKRT
ncbi:putative Ig domain-containing protein [Nibricoccus sp. IMCC34717]|uniref:putative Ig domain-containing protein n=1 Tax=Nibricoccus sp. IMCC34717 TaxID=3034021 RepID=UPI00384AE64F